MSLKNCDLEYYDKNILRLPANKRTEYHEQVDNLIKELSKHLIENSELKIKRVVKAGSFAKYTILKKTIDDEVDVDVVFYIENKNITDKTLNGINNLIYNLMIKTYPNKSVKDFEIQRRAATVTFVKSGLSVDIVPVIQDVTNQEHGWQYDLKTKEKNLTCAPCHIKFVQNRKNEDKHYRTLVRMAKRWRNFVKPEGLKSFHIELILAYLQDKNTDRGSIEEKFLDFLLFIAQTKLEERIDFPENQNYPKKNFDDLVVIIDPANHENNVASRISKTEKEKIVKMATTAWEIGNFASIENNIDMWKQIFGPKFKIKD